MKHRGNSSLLRLHSKFQVTFTLHKGVRFITEKRIAEYGLLLIKMSIEYEDASSVIACTSDLETSSPIKPRSDTDDEPGQKTKKSWSCNECSFTSTKKYNLTRHVCIIRGESEHQCNDCGRIFSNEDERDAHKATHQSDFMCDVCGKHYKSRNGIKLHMKQLHGNVPGKYSCHVCSKTFHLISHYEGHVNMHHGMKPFQCMKCKKRFGYKSNYSRHVTDCDGEHEYICTICSQQFSNNRGLKEHHRGKHTNQAYTCNNCKKSFAWRSGFLKHQKKCQMI